ncbi:site-specific integrase [Cryptosporangium sp. NPDC051539]|uniref:site-specific integrase n=1 Tax=Cryptosporangium sp. NPDC051539 TaxID=3363962 RepID=UPI00378DB220
MLFTLGQILDDAINQGTVARNVAELVDRSPQTWAATDFRKRTLTVRAARVSVDGDATESDPKSESGGRTLPVTDELIDVLKRARGGRQRTRRSPAAHDARRTCGTLLHLQGVPVAVIAAWLGHADAAFTMRTYVHPQEDALKDAAKALTKRRVTSRRQRRTARNHELPGQNRAGEGT